VVALNRRDHGDRFGFQPFEKSAMDVRYAVDLIAQRGAGRVVLVGHSYGTAVVPYYLATAMDSRVAAAILLAPIADFRAASARMLGQAEYDAAVRGARQKLTEGKGGETYLMPSPVRGGPPALMSYDVFLNKRGPDSKAVPATLLQTVSLPILAVRDPADPFPGTLPPAQEQLLAANKRLEYVLLPDTRDGRMDPAAHGFVGRETAVMRLLLEWLAKHGM
jgi:pimeloyl-ACP methyl ester carboxylesterase